MVSWVGADGRGVPTADEPVGTSDYASGRTSVVRAGGTANAYVNMKIDKSNVAFEVAGRGADGGARVPLRTIPR
jgi:hypothetical protein